MSTPQIILICGGSCSGKSLFAHMFKNAYVLEMDHFYIGKKNMKQQPDGSYDFDAPEAVDIAHCARAADELKSGKSSIIPVFDMMTSERTGTQTIALSKEHKFIIIPGIFSFYPPLGQVVLRHS